MHTLYHKIQKISDKHPAKFCQYKNISKPQEPPTFGRLTANPFVLIRSMSFGVLVGIL
jgi:hypothetical protein